MLIDMICFIMWFFFQAEDGIRDLVRSRGLGDVYKRQLLQVLGNEFFAWNFSHCVQNPAITHPTGFDLIMDLSLIHI